MTPAARIEMQERCLALHIADLRALPRPCITDRTPLDFIAYAIAEVPMHSGIDRAISRRIAAYVENCLRVTREHYGAIAVLTPLPFYAPEAGKPPPCLAYQSHIQLLIEGAVSRLNEDVPVGRVRGFALDSRVHQVADFFVGTLADLDLEQAARLVH